MSKHICICMYRNIHSEPRVLRQAHTLQRRGWKVTLAGFSDHTWGSQEHDICAIERVVPSKSWILPQTLFRAACPTHFAWRMHPQNRAGLRALENAQTKWDCIIAHDWECSPLAHHIAQQQNIPFFIDVHEYAKEEYCFTGDWLRWWKWKYIDSPHVDAIQKKYFHLASGITTVCDGIASLLQQDYGLPVKPTTVRSVPFYEEHPFRPCGEKIRIVYHGGISASRRLDTEVLIRTVPLLAPHFEVEIRGQGLEQDKAALRALVQKLEIADRVLFTPLVPFEQIVAEAHKADIGYAVFINFSPQMKFLLPNKLFENTMGGLALCASDLPEMAAVIHKYEQGVLVPDCTPKDIATVLNSLTREDIDAMKRKSLLAAKELCWEAEENKMLETYGLME